MSFLFGRRPNATGDKADATAPDATAADATAAQNGHAASTSGPASGKTHKIILTPPEDIEVPPPPVHSPEQQAKVDQIRAYVVDLHETGLAKDDDYYPFEEKWVHEDFLPERYLGATNWDLNAAKARIKSTLEWRRDYKPECISPDEVKGEALTGKHLISGFDRQGRPFYTVTPRNENTKNYDLQMRYMVFSFERVISIMPKGVYQLNMVMSLEGNTSANQPPMSQSRIALNLMQNHYPNRLARAICNRGPWFFTPFFRVISPFIDPVTRAKVFFNPPMTSLADPSQITTEWEGGQHDYEWDFESYWSQLLEHCGINPDGSRVEKPTAPATELSNGPPVLADVSKAEHKEPWPTFEAANGHATT
ncbi:hypothetical protein V8E36_002452 [Tilletia maclaganii]